MNIFKKLYDKFFNKKTLMLESSSQVNSENTQSSTLFKEMIRIGDEIRVNPKSNFKDEITKILSLEENELESYVRDKCKELNSKSIEKEVSLNAGEQNVNRGWINQNSTYLPSGNRSKGFKISNSFLLDYCQYLRSTLGKIDTKKLEENLTDCKLLHMIDLYQTLYFGDGYDEVKRKEIFGYGNLNSIGESLQIEELKNQGVARCIEKSACFNELSNFLGLDSSLVLSDASLNNSNDKVRTCILCSKIIKRNVTLRSQLFWRIS